MKWFHAAASQSSLRPAPGKSGRKEARWPPQTACIASTLRFHPPPTTTTTTPQRAELGNEGWKKEEEKKKKQVSWAVQQVGRRLHEEPDAKSSSAAPGRRRPGGSREKGGVNSLTAAHLQPGANPQLQFTDPLQSILAGSEGKKQKDEGQRRRGGRSFFSDRYGFASLDLEGGAEHVGGEWRRMETLQLRFPK